ncbi:MAG: hypothetical protein QNJ05_00345 [Woeseiaceae bacterium]|nr:hypothetical protein [Woeseiaceae bacterium]
MNDSNDAFEKRAKQLFDDSVDSLDAATLSRLNQARHAAVEKSPRRWPPLLRWAPAGGLATAAAVALLLMQSPALIETPGDASTVDMEILLSEDNLEMLEDLEFYDWIDLAETGNGDSVG